jgi:hypothetical protein
MGVPTLEVGYTSATTGRGDHEVHKGHVVALGGGSVDVWTGKFVSMERGNILVNVKVKVPRNRPKGPEWG